MLVFEQVVNADNSEASIYVFNDKEKGHTVYLSHSGAITVVEEEKKSNSKIRAAGFIGAQDSCSDCSGC